MSVEREIGNMIRTIAQEKKGSVYAAVVKSVKGNSCTVELVSDGRKLQNVSLNLVAENEEENGLLITPCENSQVLIASVNEYNWFVCQYSEIKKVTLIATKEVAINAAEKIEINAGEDGGKNGGLVILEKVQNNIDTLKTYCEAMKTAVANALTSINVAAGSAYAGSAAAGTFNSGMAAQSINFEDMENKNVTH